MEKEEILQKAKKKHPVGEMESSKINKSCWIAVIACSVVAVAMIIAEGVLKHFSAIYAIACVCYTWASVFYFCQFFVAKRPWPVLIGAALHGLAACGMLTCYILYCVGVF